MSLLTVRLLLCQRRATTHLLCPAACLLLIAKALRTSTLTASSSGKLACAPQLLLRANNVNVVQVI